MARIMRRLGSNAQYYRPRRLFIAGVHINDGARMILAPDYPALFAASPYPYLLIAPDLTIIGANSAYLRATSKVQEEVVERHIFEAFPANPDATNFDGLSRHVMPKL